MVTVRSRRPGDIILDGILVIHYGDNDVDPYLWSRVSKSEYAQWYLRNGWISVDDIVEPPPEKPAKKPLVEHPDIGDMNVREAKRIIKDCSDEAQLKTWRRGDRRETIARAIDSRLADLLPTLDFSAEEAIEMVGNVDSIHDLQRWHKAEERKTVRTAIAKRLAELGE